MKVAIAAALVLLIAVARPAASPQAAQWSAQLSGVEAAGMKRLTSAQIAAIAALKPGTTIRPADVEAARKRLLDSGYFSSVGYSYRNRGYLLVVIFQVEEVPWTTPIVFDNFVDQTDAQLIAAIARDVPSFAGTAPDREIVLKRIAQSLERVTRDAKDPGTVGFALILNEGNTANHWRFRIDRADGPLTVCSVTLAGAADQESGALRDRSATLVGREYSRDVILQFARISLVPLLSQPMPVKGVDAVRVPATEACRRGVAVTVTMGTYLFSTVFGV